MSKQHRTQNKTRNKSIYDTSPFLHLLTIPIVEKPLWCIEHFLDNNHKLVDLHLVLHQEPMVAAFRWVFFPLSGKTSTADNTRENGASPLNSLQDFLSGEHVNEYFKNIVQGN